MPVAPLQLQPIVERIRTLCVGDGDGYYREAARAADRAAAMKSGEFAKPGAFVVEPAYQAGSQPGNGSSGLVMQDLSYELGVLTGVQNYGSTRGEQQGIDAEVLRARLFNALVGWAPVTAGFEIEAGSGQLLDFDDQVFWYLDTFRLVYHIRNNG